MSNQANWFICAVITTTVLIIFFATNNAFGAGADFAIQYAKPPQVIPEPSTLILFGVGITGLLSKVRKK